MTARICGTIDSVLEQCCHILHDSIITYSTLITEEQSTGRLKVNAEIMQNCRYGIVQNDHLRRQNHIQTTPTHHNAMWHFLVFATSSSASTVSAAIL